MWLHCGRIFTTWTAAIHEKTHHHFLTTFQRSTERCYTTTECYVNPSCCRCQSSVPPKFNLWSIKMFKMTEMAYLHCLLKMYNKLLSLLILIHHFTWDMSIQLSQKIEMIAIQMMAIIKRFYCCMNNFWMCLSSCCLKLVLWTIITLLYHIIVGGTRGTRLPFPHCCGLSHEL